MRELIQDLDDATAIRVLRSYAAAHSRDGDYQTDWSPELHQALLESTASAQRTAPVHEGELAREGLLLLSDDPQYHQTLTALIQGPPAQRFLDATTIALGTAALIALQTHVKFERTKDGRFHFKIEKKPLPLDLMRKLLAYFSHGPSGKP